MWIASLHCSWCGGEPPWIGTLCRVPPSVVGGNVGPGLCLDECAGGHEVVDANEGARGESIAEELFADLCELASVADVGDEHGHLHDVVLRATRGFHDRLESL